MKKILPLLGILSLVVYIGRLQREKDVYKTSAEYILEREKSPRNMRAGRPYGYTRYSDYSVLKHRLKYHRKEEDIGNTSVGALTEKKPHKTSPYFIEEILVGSKDRAEDIIYELRCLINEYGCVSISDLYLLINLKSSYSDEKYGWYNLDSAYTRPYPGIAHDGMWYVVLPKPFPLN